MHRGPTVDPGPLWDSRIKRADRLAKSRSKQPQSMSTSTYHEAKTLLWNSQKCQWKRATGDYNPSTDPISRLARHEQTTIFRLRTGHCGLRAHLRRIGIMDSALRDCKEVEQTIHHILQDCTIWRKQRHQSWPQDESTTNKLWAWQHVDWGSKRGSSTAEEEEAAAIYIQVLLLLTRSD